MYGIFSIVGFMKLLVVDLSIKIVEVSLFWVFTLNIHLKNV